VASLPIANITFKPLQSVCQPASLSAAADDDDGDDRRIARDDVLDASFVGRVTARDDEEWKSSSRSSTL